MKKILIISAIIVMSICAIQCGNSSREVPFVGNYTVKMDLSYMDTTSAYMQMYVILASLVDSANGGSLIPYRVSFTDSVFTAYYSGNQTDSYAFTYQKKNKKNYALVLDKQDTVHLEIRDTGMVMLFPDNMAFFLTKQIGTK